MDFDKFGNTKTTNDYFLKSRLIDMEIKVIESAGENASNTFRTTSNGRLIIYDGIYPILIVNAK